MRIAVLSDIHANLEALEAALADVERRGAGKVLIAGDLVGDGPDPAGVVNLLRAGKFPAIRGNVDNKILAAAGLTEAEQAALLEKKRKAEPGPDAQAARSHAAEVARKAAGRAHAEVRGKSVAAGSRLAGGRRRLHFPEPHLEGAGGQTGPGSPRRARVRPHPHPVRPAHSRCDGGQCRLRGPSGGQRPARFVRSRGDRAGAARAGADRALFISLREFPAHGPIRDRSKTVIRAPGPQLRKTHAPSAIRTASSSQSATNDCVASLEGAYVGTGVR